MNALFAEMRRLHDRGPMARGLVVDTNGVMLGPHCVLIERTKNSYRRIDTAALDRLIKAAFDDDTRLTRFSLVLDRITEALAAGDLVKAQLLGLEIPLKALNDRQLKRLRSASTLIKAGFNPNQARVPAGNPGAGEWTSEENQDQPDEGGIEPVAGKAGHTPAEKERFVEAHLADARKIAEKLDVPVENILALSALESGWGDDSRFAREGNNFFSLHSPARFETGSMRAEDDPKVMVATFASYADSARSFADKCGEFVQSKADPRKFAAALQDRCKYGIKRDGSKVPTFVGDFAGTAHSIRSIIARRQI